MNLDDIQLRRAELQKLVELPPNVIFMGSPFLILTQCKITEKHLGSALHKKTHLIRDLRSSHIIFLF